MAGLHFDITGDNSDFMRKLQETQAGVKNASNKITQSGESIEDMFSKLTKAAAAFGAGFSAQQLVKQLVNVRGEFQKLEVAFETMLGNKERSDALMQQIVKTAATTPFNLQDVANGAKQLLAYGIEAENVNETLIRLGDIAAGLSIPLGDLTYLYGTTRAQGRLYTEDFNQFTGRGIPMIEMLAEKFGVAESEVKGLVEAGRVGFPEVQSVIESLTNEGGKFGGLMEKQSKTLSGQISNLEDSFQQMFNEIGQGTEGVLSGGISVVASLVENYEKVGKVLMSLVATYGAYKAAVIVAAATSKGWTIASMAQYKWLLLVEKAQKMLNATMLKNPYVLATTAIVALTAALYNLSKSSNAADIAQKNFNKTNEEAKNKLSDIKTKSEEYLGIIRDENATMYDRTVAYDNLSKIMPALTSQYSMLELAAANSSIVAKQSNDELNKMEFSEVEKRIGELRKQISQLNEQMKTAGQGAPAIQERIDITEEQLKREEEQYKKMIQNREKAEWEALPVEQKISIKTQEKTEIERQFKEAKQKLESFIKESDSMDSLIKPKDYYLEFQLRSNFEYLKQQYEKLNGEVSTLMESTPKAENIQVITNRLISTEQNISQARSSYASSGSDDDKKELEELETTYKTLTDTYKSMTDQTWVTAKQIADNRIKLEQETTKALLQQQIEQTVNKKEQLRLQYEAELAAIDQSEREFKKSNRGATSIAFDSQRQIAKTDYEIQVKVLDDEWQKFMKELQEGTAKMQEDAELESMQRELATATDITTQLELQEKIRKRMLQQELSDIDKEESEAIKTANENGQSTEAVTAEFDKRRQVIIQKSEAEGLAERLRMYEEYANKVIDIEQRKNEKIKSINQNKQLTPEQKKEQTEKVISIAEFEQANAFGGDAAEVISGDIAGIVQQIMSMSIEQLMAQIPIIKSELERLKKTGANIDEIILAQTKLEAAQKALTQQTSKLGSVTDDTAEGIKKKYKEAADVLKSINDVCDSVSESFGDLLGETGQDALSVIKTITSSVIGVITAIQSTATAAAAGVSAVEKASVILTVISLAVQAIMSIVNVMTKYFSKNAQIQKQIDQQTEKVEKLNEQYENIERAQKSQTGRKYWETQIELSKNLQEQIKELDEAILLAQEQVDSAATQKKKEEAEEQLDELEEERYDAIDKNRETLQEFYDELATTDLSSFSQSLAESIVEGWENGLEGMGDAWETAMDDLMRSMLTKQLALELEENLKGVFDAINDSFSEGDTELSESDIAAIQAEYEAAKQSAEDKAKAYEELYNSLGLAEDSEEDLEGSSGGFESMSQDTADELNGRFTAIQISTASIDTKMDTIIQGNGQLLSAAQQFCANVSLIAGIADNQLNELRQINENTAVLSEMNVKLKRIEENTSRL